MDSVHGAPSQEGDSMTPLIKELVALDAEVAMLHTWFDLGQLQRFEFRWGDLPGARLPFEHCAICCRDKNGSKLLILASQADDTAILLCSFKLLPDHYRKSPMFAVVMDAEKGGCYIAGVEGENEVSKEQAAPIVGVLAEFLKAVHPIGYRAAAKPNSLTNQRRAARGKAPLIYDWHTVTIEPATPKGEVLGGTHASPRQHERRGHWRNLADGRRVWVRHCIVGNAALGTIFKDYEVKKSGKDSPCP